MFNLHTDDPSDVLYQARLVWRLYTADNVSFTRHLYKSILKREPEPTAVEKAENLANQLSTTDKINYIFHIISSEEAQSHHKEQYLAKVITFFSALGYGHSTKQLAKNCIVIFPEEESIFNKSDELATIISANTEQSYLEFESNFGLSTEQLSVDVASLTSAAASLSARFDRLDDSFRALNWQISDLTSKLKPQSVSAEHQLAEISEMLAVLLTRFVETAR